MATWQSKRMNIINCEKFHTKTDLGDYILILVELIKTFLKIVTIKSNLYFRFENISLHFLNAI